MTHFSVYGVVILLIICPTAIIGNLLLMIAYTKDPLKLIKYSSSYFIFNIAIVDLLSSCALMCNKILSFGNSVPEVAKPITVVLYNAFIFIVPNPRYPAILLGTFSILESCQHYKPCMPLVVNLYLAGKHCSGGRESICGIYTAKLKILNKNKILAKLLFQANFCLK